MYNKTKNSKKSANNNACNAFTVFYELVFLIMENLLLIGLCFKTENLIGAWIVELVMYIQVYMHIFTQKYYYL